MTDEMTRKAIEEQFKTLYESDPELRHVLSGQNVGTFSIEEKY